MQFRYFLITALSVVTLNITNVKAMEQENQPMDVDSATSGIDSKMRLNAALTRAMFSITTIKAMEQEPLLRPNGFEGQAQQLPGVTPEILFKAFALLQLLPHDVCLHIFHDLFYMHVHQISAYLQSNRSNPDEVINLIGQSLKMYGYEISVNLLEMALADAQMWIGDIRDSKSLNNCLHLLSANEERGLQNQNLIKTILCVAGIEALTLIVTWAKYDNWSAWHDAIYYGRDDIVDRFIDWAVDNNMIIELLSAKTRSGKTGLHAAARHGRVGILKTLLAQANKCGIVEELMDVEDWNYNTAVTQVKKYEDDANVRREMILIIELYRILAARSLKSND